MITALVHRYDNEPDILAVEPNGCSEVFQRSASDAFDYVIVVPTLKARTSKAVIAQALSSQYQSDRAISWPGRDDRCNWRVDVASGRYITVDVIKKAFEEAGIHWAVIRVNLPDWLIEDSNPA